MLLLISVLIGIAALFCWLSARVLKLPNTIGTMLLTAITSLALLIRSVNSAPIEILLSLALAMGGYVLAEHIGVSAPLEAVAAGLILRSLIERLPEHTIAHRDLN